MTPTDTLAEPRELDTTGLDPGRWSLAELLPTPSTELVDERLAELEELTARLEKSREELTDELDRGRFHALLAQYEELLRKCYVLSAYGSLWFSTDTQSSEALAYRNRMDQTLTEVQNRVLFLSLWWKEVDDEVAARLLPTKEENADLRHYLEDVRRFKPFALPEASEQIINTKDANGMSALLTLYTMLTNRLEYELEVDGEAKKLTRDEISSHVYSTDADLRERAYRELMRVAEREATVLGQIYVHRVRDWHSENVRLRTYASPIAVRNRGNDIPDEAIATLLEVVAGNAPIFQRYFRLKAGWLGMERLRRYDIYAPLAASEKRIPYGEAIDLVLDTFGGFDAGFAAAALRVFTDDHIDAEVRPGKRGGAFCATVLPEQTPWLLLNYTGRVRDVATLAHELGHAVHSMLSADHSVLVHHSSLPLAETASVFAEILLTERLLEGETSPTVRRELLAAQVDDIYATVMRQAFFVRYELAAHEAILAGSNLDQLHDLYFSTLEEQFGDALDLTSEFRHEWVSIPHIFHTPFYCYAYSFGQLLVLALYRRYQQEGAAFIPAYLELLAHGGSARPQEILSEAGVDILDPAFWQGGCDVIAGMVDDLEGT
jgi:oligoendopeptidase F